MFRVGIGHDTHRTIEGRPLILGGVSIPADFGLEGHSDADVLLHAVTDAILGAAGHGDIGEWFPDTSAEFAGADSRELLRRVIEQVHGQDWSVVNLDGIIFAERPKLSAYKQTIKESLSTLLGVDPSVINIKAKTGERVGPIGRGEAMEAQVVVLLSKED
ncbi:MAG: 2-C-methyl-D-erythritol 2,4-cyclodiphosphate synthase [Planctomycetaceae bacterium]|nr:2-C-methyl-D-erythritol 2,4-cyclodiphosphate synthase [Planctomycetaceae bacterium]